MILPQRSLWSSPWLHALEFGLSRHRLFPVHPMEGNPYARHGHQRRRTERLSTQEDAVARAFAYGEGIRLKPTPALPEDDETCASVLVFHERFTSSASRGCTGVLAVAIELCPHLILHHPGAQAG